jgi:hypothetical protein
MEDSPVRAGGDMSAGPRNLEAVTLLIAAGAIMLFVSLFLQWYSPNAEAWDVFEVWDLVLAALAITALVAAAGRMGIGTPRPASWLIGSSIAALVIVVYALIDPPPVAQAISAQGSGFGDPDTGLWLALAATILMTAGALLSVARISVAFSAGSPGPGPGAGAGAGPGRPERSPGLADPAGGYRGRRPVDPAGSNPAVPQPPRVADPVGNPRSGRSPRGAPGADRGPLDPIDPLDPVDPAPIPPTESSRRI